MCVHSAVCVDYTLFRYCGKWEHGPPRLSLSALCVGSFTLSSVCWFFSVALGHTDLRAGDPALCVGSSVSL